MQSSVFHCSMVPTCSRRPVWSDWITHVNYLSPFISCNKTHQLCISVFIHVYYKGAYSITQHMHRVDCINYSKDDCNIFGCTFNYILSCIVLESTLTHYVILIMDICTFSDQISDIVYTCSAADYEQIIQHQIWDIKVTCDTSETYIWH